MLSAPRPRAWAAFPRAVALGREAGECVERSRCVPQGEMASYVDNSFRQAVMKNPAERTPQVRRAASRRGLGSADCALPRTPALLVWGSSPFPHPGLPLPQLPRAFFLDRPAIVALSFAVLYAALPVTDLARGSAGTRCCLWGLFLSGPILQGL